LLSRVEVFEGLGAQMLERVAGRITVEFLPRGRTLFTEGEEGSSCFILAMGTVKLSRLSPEGKEVVVRIVRPGELFAEVVLFGDDRYPVTAVTTGDANLLRLPRRELHQLLEAQDFREEFFANLMQKLRYLTDQLFVLTSMDVQQRFAHFLEERFGRRETYNLQLTKREVASALGAVPETFSRMLNRLKKEGLVRWEREVLEVSREFWLRYGGPRGE
ncbi:MAG: Crp/Fnr family transcriptional regulator, partial [Alkalispirochaetaceae bacterium]